MKTEEKSPPPSPPELLTPKQVLFIQNLASGKFKYEYEAAIAANYAESRARATASRIMANPDARDYLKALQNHAAEKSTGSKVELLDFLFGIIRESPKDANEANPRAVPVHLKEETFYVHPDKLAVIDRIMRLNGWDKQSDNDNAQAAGVLAAILQKRDI